MYFSFLLALFSMFLLKDMSSSSNTSSEFSEVNDIHSIWARHWSSEIKWQKPANNKHLRSENNLLWEDRDRSIHLDTIIGHYVIRFWCATKKNLHVHAMKQRLINSSPLSFVHSVSIPTDYKARRSSHPSPVSCRTGSTDTISLRHWLSQPHMWLQGK